MSRFSEVNYDATSQTVDVGSGLVWDDVYAVLEPHGVNVVGGRVTGVGVDGFTLGGGKFPSITYCITNDVHTFIMMQDIPGSLTSADLQSTMWSDTNWSCLMEQ